MSVRGQEITNRVATWILLGPFEAHQEAMDAVQTGRQLAEAADPRAVWWSFGTCSSPRQDPIRVTFRPDGDDYLAEVRDGQWDRFSKTRTGSYQLMAVE